MRFAPTRSEEWLWRRLAGSQIGFAFRRQLVIAHWIVDFASTAARLAVEVDGDAHVGRDRHDANRDRALQCLGWQVLRIAEQDVFRDLERVVRRIQVAAHAAIAARALSRR